MTAYRERMKAGDYEPPNQGKRKQTKSAAKKTTTKTRTTRKR